MKKDSQSHFVKMAFKRSVRLNFDVPLVLVTVTLLVYGILMVYSASWDYSISLGKQPEYLISRQIAFLGLGSLCAIILALINYHHWKRLAVWGMGVTILLLLSVLIINEVRHGASRTLIGGSYQPSELAKLMIVIYLSVWLNSKRDQLADVNFGLIPLAAILGIVGGLILRQPDISAASTVIILGGILFFLAGGELRQIFIFIVIAIIVGMVIVTINPTGSSRVDSYRAGLGDFSEGSYHMRRSVGAFALGSWFGVGIGKSTSKYTGLPVPPTDSIFAIVGEETGVVGATILVVLYILFLWRGLVIAMKAPDGLGAILAAGISIWITLEAFINMLVMIGLLPFAGNALPLISAGGSNLLVTLASIGILLSISRLSEQTEENDRRVLSEVIDLRRRNRRRRLSRSRRSPSTAKG